MYDQGQTVLICNILTPVVTSNLPVLWSGYDYSYKTASINPQSSFLLHSLYDYYGKTRRDRRQKTFRETV